MAFITGKLLVASPRLGDPNFVRAVVLMVQHNEDGALGLVLNRPTKVAIRDAWEEAHDSPCQIEGHIHSGGPCEGPLMVLHTLEDASQTLVIPGVHFSSQQENIEQIIAQSTGPTLFCIGYSGWGSGQLESELEEKVWLVTPATAQIVFDRDNKHQWAAVMKQLLASAGMPFVNPNLMPRDPSVN